MSFLSFAIISIHILWKFLSNVLMWTGHEIHVITTSPTAFSSFEKETVNLSPKGGIGVDIIIS
jgi:hypothetical protein